MGISPPLMRLYEDWPRVFLLWPRKLADGRLAWLQWVYKQRPIHKWYGGCKYYMKWFDETKYHLEKRK